MASALLYPSTVYHLTLYRPSDFMYVSEIDRPDDLVGCRLLWRSLLARTPGATFFHSFDWLEPYWRHFGHNQQLRVLVVRSDDKPVGILPLVVRTERTRFGPARVLAYPLDQRGIFYGPIGPQPAATLTAALQYIRSRPRDWDMLSLRSVHRDGADRGRTQRAMQFVRWQPLEEVQERAPCVGLSGTWDDYWATRDGDLRNNVQASERRLAEHGEVVFTRYRPAGIAYGDDDPRWDLFETSLELALTLGQPSVESYLRDAHEAAARAGGLDLNVLFVGGRPLAFAYNYYYGGHICCFRMGNAAQTYADDAGTVLMHRMLQDCFERGDHTFDLGPGSPACKTPWQTSLETSYRYTYFPAGAVRAQALRAKSHLKKWLMTST